MTTSVAITAGEAYAVLGIVAVSAASLGGIIWFACKAGISAQEASTAIAETKTAAAVQSSTETMSNTAANTPAIDADVIAAFQKGVP